MSKLTFLRRATVSAGAATLSLAAYAGLGAAQLAMAPHAAASPRPVSAVSVTRTAHAPGHATVTARFRQCVTGVTAYAEPASGDYQDFSAESRARGRVFTLRVPLSRADETGRWHVVSVIGTACRGGQVVQLMASPQFTVTGAQR